MNADIADLPARAEQAAGGATSLDEIQRVSTDFLGKKSALAEAKKALGALDPDARRSAGQLLNEVRDRIESLLDARRHELSQTARVAQLETERLDLTEIRERTRLGHLHLVTQARDRLEDLFVGMGFTVAEGPEIEDDWHNFGALNFAVGHPARAMQDTFYVNYGEPESTLLRTHTSPVQIRVMQSQSPPIYSIMPGRVFRQDTADATHMPVFHQIEGLVVDRGITFADLAGTLEAFTSAYFGPGFTSRLRPSYFPFTEPSAEYDIRRPDGSWLELGGCGMVHPNVLLAGGIDPEEYSGFAFGFGIDRLALMRHGVDDLREMFINDVRFLRQF
ncbi:MAG: phenylalanine--tRNA ligase subunit alpha [Actinobacteria bacterium]|uniref:Phenylalanine--tRNA ligase alpha subunit n=1 Tax=freshwater metagenome TaxID=449393 RepID=A0A6J7HLC5_9ZZZZ|nr:phenylalanine--tRNA ligase subunit alpha [Actinomycetota bacterium]MSX86842.1 phenylalanine--tRNA ligase subunit alpha [Actinomycetota bacterium]MSY70645.1 phenylalanine--tRNA ligase subunit alpha [Actinomycetota bacterium]